MHPGGIFHEADLGRLADLVAERGLAVIVAGAEPPIVGHAPVLLSGGRLRFHLSRDNRACPAIEASPRVLAVITGADAYISPDWYALADQVPTWNYMSAEIEGPTRIMDAGETRRLLDDLAAHFEARLAPKPPWTRAKMDPDRFEAMLGAIVGYEMTIERFEGVAKLSQNKPESERRRLAAALTATGEAGAKAVAKLMARDAPAT
ncbi:MAG TPA: FMN-binding negative transcriptional regulator [Caulobacteraceae bacterium]|nr:FMN-binding negative transcriptional regulator [Caulobacteraceae bacterium]